MNLSVWPVEFFAIRDEVRRAEELEPQFNDNAVCGFLKDRLCTIYPFRPLICRTHGLPLVYWHDETDPPGYGVMFCEKNFQDAEDLDFTSENTLNMDEVNEELARLNITFIQEHQELALKPESRIELREILD